MELKAFLQVILLVNLSRSRDVFDTEEARVEWERLSHSGHYNLTLYMFVHSLIWFDPTVATRPGWMIDKTMQHSLRLIKLYTEFVLM